ncbi:MAG: class I SAM-dependent methyltransferase, partial [Ruminococcus sp.]|nr:class I SAM-dependent methyltransferase [Ruminococcus sp.]
MSFRLNDVVPWGRNFSEYVNMFNLTESDLSKKIAGFGDGPASFNYEATAKGYDVVSFDPVYQFSKEEISKRIEEVRIIVMQQMKENMDNYVWENIRNLNELENLRMSAMRLFLSDYDCGKAENRYIFHALPEKLPYNDDTFDIGLSSHFLMMYTSLGYDFHIKAISEMLRVCREVRIFPIVDLDANKTSLINDVLSYFNNHYTTEIVTTNYEFQKGENKLLI